MDHKKTGPQELARLTEIPVDRWKNIRRGRVRASTEKLDACTPLWPEYGYWLITGNTLPEAGQISSEIEETRKNLNAAG